MTKREKTLGSVFLGLIVLVIVGGYVLFQQKATTKLQLELIGITAKANKAKLQESEHLKLIEDKEWLKNHQPKVMQESEAGISLRKFVNNSGKGVVKISKLEGKAVGEPEDHYFKNRVTVIGTLNRLQLKTWLLELHSPKDFRAVTYLKVVQLQKMGDEVRCQLTIEQWNSKPTNQE